MKISIEGQTTFWRNVSITMEVINFNFFFVLISFTPKSTYIDKLQEDSRFA